ncbi:hypothetical protein [Streptomyces sp. NPDC057280]|uniref:hypothetical protein n=1 Tax=Streptomyces sp. NPDC057280 TaxID=3346081 RepID=UPI0036342323
MANSYAQPVLRTADISEALRIVERLLAIADLTDLEVDFDTRISSPRSLSQLLALLPNAAWWAVGDRDGASDTGNDPSACLPVWLRSWAERPETVRPFLEAVGDSPATARWDFNAWPEAPEIGLGAGGTRGAFVTLCVHARDLDLQDPAADHTVFIHAKQVEAERIPWLATQVDLQVIGDLVMAPY